MEQLLLERLELLQGGVPSDPRAMFLALASCRSLISNPTTSEAAARAVLDALARFLIHEDRPSLIRHAIKLLGDITVLHYALLPRAVEAARPFLGCGKRLAAEALSVLVSAAQGGGEGSAMVRSVLPRDVLFQLAASRAVAVRSQLIRLLVLDSRCRSGEVAEGERPMLVIHMLFGFTADLCPSIRSAALDGLLSLCTNASMELEASLAQCCFDVAVALFHDEDTTVRIRAIRLMSEVGGILAANKEGMDGISWFDAMFLLLCSSARDMDMKLRVEIFIALGKVKLVSDYILLQCLSKKPLRSDNRGKPVAKSNVDEYTPPPSCAAAGVFIHGLEDEFHQVRRAACHSLGKLSILSTKFAGNALNFLMDMMNDDSTAVQLETLQSLAQMAMHDNLDPQERHMHMFFDALACNSASIRVATRNVIQLMKFLSLAIFKMSITKLFENLEAYPEDEEDVLRVLFCLSKGHQEFATRSMEQFMQEMSRDFEELDLDRPRVAALLVFILSPYVSNENLPCDVPAKVASYAIPLLGRISHSLQGSVSQDALLTFLCKISGFPHLGTESDYDEVKMKESETTLYQKLVVPISKQILETAIDTWPMIKAQCTVQVLSTLRGCKEELEIIAQRVTAACRACLFFAMEYVHIIQLISEIWERMHPKYLSATKMRSLDILLEKLDYSLRKVRHCFPGLSKEEESHILELMLLACLLSLSEVRISKDPLMGRIQFLVSHLEMIRTEGSELSHFVKELKVLHSRGATYDISSGMHLNYLLESFSLEPMVFCGKFRYTKAELEVLSEESELPLAFVPGLPVGITFNITLYNVSNDARVWLKMSLGESVQYTFLNLLQFKRSDFERRCTVNVPFFCTPKASFFMLKVCLCLECEDEPDTQKRKGQGGPRCKIVSLCEEKDIYLADIDSITYEV